MVDICSSKTLASTGKEIQTTSQLKFKGDADTFNIACFNLKYQYDFGIPGFGFEGLVAFNLDLEIKFVTREGTGT